MEIKVGSRVKIIKVIKSNPLSKYNNADYINYIKRKQECIGLEANLYGIPYRYSDYLMKFGLPEGKLVYSLENDNGEDMSPFGWFAEEFELVK